MMTLGLTSLIDANALPTVEMAIAEAAKPPATYTAAGGITDLQRAWADGRPD
jgi:hypothetical protein